LVIIIRERATQEQIEKMLQNRLYVKLAVDIEKRILAGGGDLHADCEKALLEDGSRQVDIWGANWFSFANVMEYESMINLRPRQNRSMAISDPAIREQVFQITQTLLGEL
jgi:hypothetical protein